MNPWVKMCLKLYRKLARAFPHEFQMVYGEDVVRLGEDAAPQIYQRYGFWGLIRLVGDLALRVPIEYLSELRQDMVYASRTISKTPGFAVIAILSLGLGIGLSTMAFTQINSLVLKPLPGASDPEALVTLASPVPYPFFESYRDQHSLFTGAGAFVGPIPFEVSIDGAGNSSKERIYGQLVSPGYFSTLGVTPEDGSFFSKEQETPDAPLVVVVSNRFWRSHLQANSGAVGRTLRINGRPATIVGIGPPDFAGFRPLTPSELFVPIAQQPRLAPELGNDAMTNRDLAAFSVFLRLAPGVQTASAEAALDVITRNLQQQDKKISQPEAKGHGVRLLPGGRRVAMPPESIHMLYVMWTLLVGLILTLACTNLANILLARASERRKEFAIRLAVGASRFRLIRQLLTESLLLAVCGGALGLALAYASDRYIGHLKVPGGIPLNADFFHLDFDVFVFAFAISVVTGFGLGLLPALAATRSDISSALKAGAVARLRAHRRFGLRNLFVGYQVAASLTLLLLTGFLAMGYAKLLDVHPGFEIGDLYLLSLDPVRDGYSIEKTAALLEALPEQLGRLSAVNAATVIEEPPFGIIAVPNAQLSIPAAPGTLTKPISMVRTSVGANYFTTLNVTLLRGRDIMPQDQRIKSGKDLAIPAVINQAASRALFGGDDPIGRRVSDGAQAYEVTAVAPDLRAGFLNGPTQTQIFVPLTDSSFHRTEVGEFMLLIRSRSGTDAIAAIRAKIHSIDPNLSLFNVRSMGEDIDEIAGLFRVDVDLFGGVGLFGLILASIGLSGVTAYTVARRRKEIGIRMALGARPAQVLRLVLKEGVTLVTVGAIIGFAAALAIARTVAAVVNVFAQALSMTAANPVLLIGAPGLLVSIAMIACWIPARRSAKIDPLIALREE